MGNKTGKQPQVDPKDSERSAAIDQQINKTSRDEKRVLKLLLLGAGESGKSTLFKQSVQLYGKGWDKTSKEPYIDVIRQNILTGINELVKQSDILATGENTAISAANQTAKHLILTMPDNEISDLKIGPDIVSAIDALWAEPGIQRTWELRARFQIPDSSSYFFETKTLHRVADPDYQPIYEDVLRCRSRTTGIVETDISMGYQSSFKIMDVGGQRSERKKWIHCFNDVTAVIFVAAINEYDMCLFEDHTVNRITEALSLFNKTCNSGWFGNADIILFLNKRDLFEDKIKIVDLGQYFPEYKDGSDYTKASAFMKDKFLAQNKNSKVKVYPHVTCATDSENVRFTFEAVKSIVINSSLMKSGLT